MSVCGANCLKTVIADDNAQWRSILSEVVNSEHDVIGFAENGSDLLGTAAELMPDVITLDVSMPPMSGIRILPRLRTTVPEAVIIVVSANGHPLYIEEALDRGADAYVMKQWVLRDLLPAIRAGRRRKLG